MSTNPIAPTASTLNTAVGITTANSVIIVTKAVAENPFFVATSNNSLFRIDDKVVAAIVGVSGDPRPLVNGAKQRVAQKRFEFGESPSIEYVANTIVDQMTKAAKHSKQLSRPFNVSVLVGRINGTVPSLFQLPITINAISVNAAAIGKGASKAQAYLDENYSADLNEADAVALTLKAILQTGTMAAEEAEIAVIRADGGYSTYSLTEKRNAIEAVV